ncbi:MAG: zinc ribbon domain-containing protein [Eubacteriales bacterium]
MTCVQCRETLPDGAKFCLECGAKQNIICSCEKILPPSAKFSLECGKSTEQRTKSDTRGRALFPKTCNHERVFDEDDEEQDFKCPHPSTNPKKTIFLR